MRTVSRSEMLHLPDHVLFQTMELKRLDGDNELTFVFGCLCMKLPKRNGDDRYFQFTKLTEPEFKGVETEEGWKKSIGMMTEEGLECPIMFGAVHNSLDIPEGTTLLLWDTQDLESLTDYLGKYASKSAYYVR